MIGEGGGGGGGAGGAGGGGSLVHQVLPHVIINRLINRSGESGGRGGRATDTEMHDDEGGNDDADNVDDNADNDCSAGTSDKDGGRQRGSGDNGDNGEDRLSRQQQQQREKGGGRKKGGKGRRLGGRGVGGALSSVSSSSSNEIMQLVAADMVSRFAPLAGAALIRGAIALGKRVLLGKRGGNALYDNIVRYAGQAHEKAGSVYLSSASAAASGRGDGSSSNTAGGGGADSGDMFEAVLALATDLPEAQVVHHDTSNGGRFVIETDKMIPLGDEVYFRRVMNNRGGGGGSVAPAGTSSSSSDDPMTIEVFSFVKNVVQLRSFLADLEAHYRSAKNNQLGRQLFFFDEIVIVPPRNPAADGTLDAKPDLTRVPPHPTFSMSALHTTKSLDNVFGRCMHRVRRRVDFFVNNRGWYEKKGVPYTLGFLMHGSPGCGKTSFIKGLAKHTGRHVVNVRLSKYTTSAQLASLLHSGVIHAVHNGRSSTFEIPIDRVILVMEDIDCLSDVVLDRRGKGKEGEKQGGAEREREALRDLDVGKMIDELMRALLEKKPMDAFSITKDLKELRRELLARDDRDGRNPSSAFAVRDDPSDALRLNLSVLLNLLDGVLETPGRMMVMTSNFPERLDRALIRPGRIDAIIHFTKCEPEDVGEIVEAMRETRIAAEDVARLPGGVWTPAQVSQAVFERIDAPMEELLTYLSDAKNVRCVFDEDEDEDKKEKEEGDNDDDDVVVVRDDKEGKNEHGSESEGDDGYDDDNNSNEDVRTSDVVHDNDNNSHQDRTTSSLTPPPPPPEKKTSITTIDSAYCQSSYLEISPRNEDREICYCPFENDNACVATLGA